MSIKTPDQILADLSAEIEQDWGPTPLQDPVANRSDNLVRLVSHWGLSLADLYVAKEAFIQRDNIPALEGELLTAAVARQGVFRKQDTFSKAVIMVTGEFCAVLPEGSELLDRFGMKWLTMDDISLKSRGAGCSFGQGVVCAENSGTFTITPSELVYDNTSTPFIYSATNGIQLEVGGAQESDQSLRNRVLNRGPLARIHGTSDAALDALYAIDGVNFARYQQVESCIGNGWMFVVHGGIDAEICEAIKLHAGLGSCSLIGGISCDEYCTDVRFQKPCPILVCLKVVINCDCPEPDEDQIKTLIMSAAPRLALGNKITSLDIAKVSDQIISVQIAKKKIPLHSCPDLENVEVITDPINDVPIPWATSNPYGLCGGAMVCEEPEFVKEVRFHPWQYPIIDVNFIEIEKDCTVIPAEDCLVC